MRKHKVLIITASPRAGSNSSLAAKMLVQNSGQKIKIVDINKLKIHPCTACDKCKDKLKCVFNDDADKLIKQIEKADTIIVASPVYFTGVPGPLKTFIDRNQVQWYKKNVNLGKIKKGIIILTQGQKKAKYFKPAESEIRSFFVVNNIKTDKVLKFSLMDEQGKIKNQHVAIND